MLGPGHIVAQKYRIERLLGAGGMGAVYVATNTVLEKPVALKVMSATLLTQHDWVQRFFREGVAASKARHPGVVEVFDAGVHEGAPWMAMELLEGESLRDRLSRGRLPVAELHEIATQVLSALDAVHAVGIVHRDLKPDNIFLERTASGVRAKVLDFGIAKESDAISSLTATGAIVGTARYLAPEQARDSRVVDPRTDIYAMGVVLFECLSGQTPYEATTVPELISKMYTESPRSLASLAPDVPPSVQHVIHACLAREPEGRPQSARALSEALDQAARHGATPNPAARWETGPTPGLDPAWNNVPPPSYHRGPATYVATPPIAYAPPRSSSSGCGWVIAVLSVIGVLVAVLIVGVFALGRWAQNQLLTGLPQNPMLAGFQRTLWDASRTAMIADVNGDGTDDVVGSINELDAHGSMTPFFAAYDGSSGRQLWLSAAIGSAQSRSNSRTAIAGGRLLHASSAGVLQGYDLTNGRVSWEIPLGERAERFCRNDDASVIVVRSDQRAVLVALSDGARSDTPVPEPCIPVASDEFSREGVHSTWTYVDPDPWERENRITVEGMDLSFAARSPTDGWLVALGHRAIGTRVPMIARVGDGGWRQDIPAGDPLRAADRDPEMAAIHGQRAFVVYEMNGDNVPARLTGFALGDGRRLFDAALPASRFGPSRGGVVASDDLLLVEQGASLHAFDPATGAHRFHIGLAD